MSKIRRKVLVQMISSHQHIEMVEVETEVRMTGGFGTEGFEADLEAIEGDARFRLTTNERDETDFDMVGVLCAVLAGHNAGRIVWVKQADITKVAKTW